MLTTLFRWALYLYPAEYRRTFGTEMIAVFSCGLAEARNGNVLRLASFCLRETFGVLTDAIRCHGTAVHAAEPWAWSLEAPAVTLACYALGVVVAHDLGLWGFFFPTTYVLLIGAMAVAAWMIGRTCSIRRNRRRYGALVVAVFVSTVVIPGSLRVLEDARLAGAVASAGATIRFAMPGIQVQSFSGAVPPTHTSGLTFSRVVTYGRASATFVHHRESFAPPYEALGALFTGVLAFVSRRRVSC